MTDEEKQIISDYMGWEEDEILVGYCTGPDKMAHFDLNDAGLVKNEMVKRGEWASFETYCFKKQMAVGSQYVAWLFNAKNFFEAFCEWRKSL